jgi:hypothetical protein
MTRFMVSDNATLIFIGKRRAFRTQNNSIKGIGEIACGNFLGVSTSGGKRRFIGKIR